MDIPLWKKANQEKALLLKIGKQVESLLPNFEYQDGYDLQRRTKDNVHYVTFGGTDEINAAGIVADIVHTESNVSLEPDKKYMFFLELIHKDDKIIDVLYMIYEYEHVRHSKRIMEKKVKSLTHEDSRTFYGI